MPSPSVSSFTFPSTTEPVFSASTSEPVFKSPNHTSQPSQTTQTSAPPTIISQPQESSNNKPNSLLKKEANETGGPHEDRKENQKANIMQFFPPVTVEEQIAASKERQTARPILFGEGLHRDMTQSIKKAFESTQSQMQLSSLVTMCSSYIQRLLHSYHSAYGSCGRLTNSKMTYPYQSHSTTFTTASSIPAASSNVIESVLHSFVAESDPQQQITYEDFDQIGKMDLEELDIKWQMAMLSVRFNNLKRSRRKMKFINKMLLGETRVEFKSKAKEDTTGNATGDVADDVSNDAAEFALMGISSQESSKNLVKLINSSMSSRSRFGLGFGDTFGSDEVFDLSAPIIFDSSPKDVAEKPLHDRNVEMNNKPMWTNVANIPSFVPKAASVPADSRNRQTSVPTDSRNRQTYVPAGSRNEPASVPTDSRNRQTFVHAGSRNRPTFVHAGRPFSAGWKNKCWSRPMNQTNKPIFL
ncbi:hypothetical protein Tco_0648730 [Tanacetum coccineum]